MKVYPFVRVKGLRGLGGLKLETSVFQSFTVAFYLIDLVVANLVQCFTFPAILHIVHLETKFPKSISSDLHMGKREHEGLNTIP